MARIVKEKEYAERRKEILDVAQRLVYTKGYEQLTIQDIQDALQISKGAFYHYFSSKQALLEALIEYISEGIEEYLMPIVDDPHTPALEKFHRYVARQARWKTEHKPFLLALLRVWHMDDNVIVRQKVRVMSITRMAPMIATIVHQGIREGVLTTPFPDQVGEVLLSILFDLSENVATWLLSGETGPESMRGIECTIAVYTDALERVLGAPTGSLHLVDTEMLREWIVSLGDNV